MRVMLAKGVSGAPVIDAAGKLVGGCSRAHVGTHMTRADCRFSVFFAQVGILSETDLLWKEAGSPQASVKRQRAALHACADARSAATLRRCVRRLRLMRPVACAARAAVAVAGRVDHSAHDAAVRRPDCCVGAFPIRASYSRIGD